VAPENCHRTLAPGAMVTLPAVAIVTPVPAWHTVTSPGR